MKRTSQELLDFYGLKVGDKIRVYDNSYNLNEILDMELVVHDARLQLKNIDKIYGAQYFELTWLLDFKYEIIKQTPQLTEDEKVILRNLPEEYKWIVRDDCVNALYVHATFPRRYEDIYMSGVCQRMELFEHLFNFITWEDEPYLIEDLLK